MRRHFGVSAVSYGGADGSYGTSIQPDRVRQIGSAQRLIAPPVSPMTGHADGRESCAPILQIAGRKIPPGQAHDVAKYILDPSIPPESLAPAGHRAASALRYRLHDRFGGSAKEPVAIGEVGKSRRAAPVGSMAGDAVVHEQIVANAHGVRVRGQGGHALSLEGSESLRQHLIRLGGLLGQLPLRGPSCGAGEISQPRVDHQVPQAEHDGQHEQPQPPPRQRIVEFLKITVPDVSGRLRRGGRFSVPAPQSRQQQDHRQDIQQDDGRDQDACRGAHGVPSWRRSSSSGSMEAESNRARRAGPNAQNHSPTNIVSRIPAITPRRSPAAASKPVFISATPWRRFPAPADMR